ncbi:unnamed protein product [Urochloa humidicola]
MAVASSAHRRATPPSPAGIDGRKIRLGVGGVSAAEGPRPWPPGRARPRGWRQPVAMATWGSSTPEDDRRSRPRHLPWKRERGQSRGGRCGVLGCRRHAGLRHRPATSRASSPVPAPPAPPPRRAPPLYLTLLGSPRAVRRGEGKEEPAAAGRQISTAAAWKGRGSQASCERRGEKIPRGAHADMWDQRKDRGGK